MGNSRKNYWELLGNYWPMPSNGPNGIVISLKNLLAKCQTTISNKKEPKIISWYLKMFFW